VEQLGQLATGDLPGVVAEHPLERGRGVGDPHVGPEDQDDVGGVVDQGPEAGLAAPHVQVLGQGDPVQGQGDLGAERLQGLGQQLRRLPGPGDEDDALEAGLVYERHGDDVVVVAGQPGLVPQRLARRTLDGEGVAGPEPVGEPVELHPRPGRGPGRGDDLGRAGPAEHDPDLGTGAAPGQVADGVDGGGVDPLPVVGGHQGRRR
jgi:hypothetical protein